MPESRQPLVNYSVHFLPHAVILLFTMKMWDDVVTAIRGAHCAASWTDAVNRPSPTRQPA